MDALAGYGSDDSSASSSGPTSTPSKPQPGSSFSGLLGDVSDASEEDERVVVDRTNTAGSDDPPPAKKPKMEEGASNHSDAATAITTTATKPTTLLPDPILSKGDSSNDSWIYWKTNYLQRPLGNDHQLLSLGDTAPSSQELQENLQRLTQNNTNGNNSSAVDAPQNWADRLRSQHEFHNPHFFASVVEHFGIQDPLASAATPAPISDVRDYERKLFPIIRASTETPDTTTT
jgi:hypothetical protein